MRVLHFNCKKNGVQISTRKGDKFVSLGIAKNIAAMKKLVEKINLNDNKDLCMFSSSMDFPKEYTKNKEVLKLVEKLQG